MKHLQQIYMRRDSIFLYVRQQAATAISSYELASKARYCRPVYLATVKTPTRFIVLP